MIDLRQVRKRVIKAVDNYVSYAPLMKERDGKIIIQRMNTYCIDLQALTCTCQDYQYNGRHAPCKHIIMAVIFKNSLNHSEEEGEL